MKLPFFLARRFVASETLEEMLPVAADLHDSGLLTTVDHLGEHITDSGLAVEALNGYINLINKLANSESGIDRNISIKLSMLGQNIDESFCLENLHKLLTVACKSNAFVRLDMEGSAITESTLRIFEQVHPDYPDHVGVVLQAYLKRTREDIERLCALRARIRLCKGAYREPATIACQTMSEIRDRYLEYMEVLLSRGNYPAIATHDDILIHATKQYAASHEVDHSRFEFQMLYGLRSETQLSIAHSGYNMRVYIPYGRMWLPYFSRRLRERKENIFFILKNLLRR